MGYIPGWKRCEDLIVSATFFNDHFHYIEIFIAKMKISVNLLVRGEIVRGSHQWGRAPDDEQCFGG
jgi:hypothetical protein